MDPLINFPLGNAKKKIFHTNFFRPLLKENGYLKVTHNRSAGDAVGRRKIATLHSRIVEFN